MDYNNNQNNQNNGYQSNYSSQQTGQYSSQGAPQYQQQGAPQYQQQGAPQYQQQGAPQPHYSSQNQNAYSGQAPYQGYDPNMQYNNPYGQPAQKPGPNACQIISLIVGILSILCCCWGIFGIILGAVGLVLAIVGNKNNKHGVGTGGLVCSIVGLILSIVILGISIYGTYRAPQSIEDIYERLEQFEEAR